MLDPAFEISRKTDRMSSDGSQSMAVNMQSTIDSNWLTAGSPGRNPD